MASTLYWIHHPEHTDMFTQGYIGVTNNTNDRFEEHKNRTRNAHLKNAIVKYGWDNLIKKAIIIADEAYCLMIEAQLRAKENIGWNIVIGGGMPPKSKKGMNLGRTPWNKGKKFSEESKLKMSISHKGATPWNKELKTPDDVKLKQRLAKLGKKLSTETRIKMSQSQLNRYKENA